MDITQTGKERKDVTHSGATDSSKTPERAREWEAKPGEVMPGQAIPGLAGSWDPKPGEVAPGNVIPGTEQMAPSETGNSNQVIGRSRENQEAKTEGSMQSVNLHSGAKATKIANREQTAFRGAEPSEVS